MKIQIILAIVLLTILSLIYCDLKKPNSPQFGSLTISLIFPEDTGLRLEKATITIESVNIKIINSSNQAIVNQPLAKSGSVFTGDFEAPSGSGYTVEIDCYRSSALIFHGDATNITAQPGKTTPVNITLNSTVQAVTIFPSSITLLPNGTQQFNAYAFFPPNNDSIEVTSEATWSVSPRNAGSFSSPGLFKTSDTYTGSATIFASYVSKQGQASVTIPEPVTLMKVTIAPDSASLSNGEMKQFTCTAYFSDGSSQNVTSSATWRVDPTNAGSFLGPGLFKASDIYAGNATITASYSGKQDQAFVTKPGSYPSIDVTPSSASLSNGEMKQFTCTAYYSDGSNQNVTSSATWSVGPSNAGSFPSSGLFKASDTYTGNATITASYSGKQDQASVIINKIVTSVDVTPSNATMSNSETKQFTCTAYYSDGSNQNVTSLATWSVTPTNAGSFPSPGSFKVSDTFAGNAMIIAGYVGEQDTSFITIVSVFKIEISVNPSSVNFGNITNKTDKDTIVTIKNSINSTGNLTGNVSISGNGFYVDIGSGEYNLSPGATKEITVRFAPNPDGEQTFTGTITITHNGINKSSPILVPLEGKGVGTGRIEVTIPNSDTVWTIGDQNVIIEWDTGLLGGNVQIQLLKDYRLEKVIIASTGNDGYYSDWDVPSDLEPRDDYRIQVVHNYYTDYGSEFKIVKLIYGFASKDTYIIEDYPNENYGDRNTFVVAESGTSPYKDRNILLDFDFIRNIPQNAKCECAILKLSVFQSGSEKGTPFDISTRLNCADWAEYDANWNTALSTLGIDATYTIPIGNQNGYNSFDFNYAVKSAIEHTGDPNYPFKGFMIGSSGEQRDKEKWYYSRENADNKKPYLEVKYYIHY